jgi:transposase InsO family protein
MEAADLTRSMSKKGCSPDNAACEGFFGTVKSEMFYTRSWDGVSVEEFVTELDSYIRWSNVERIKLSSGGKSPKYALGEQTPSELGEIDSSRRFRYPRILLLQTGTY